MADIENNIVVMDNFFPDELALQIYQNLDNSDKWGHFQKSNPQDYSMYKQKLPKNIINIESDIYNSKFWINHLGGVKIPKYSYLYEVEIYTLVIDKIKNMINISDKDKKKNISLIPKRIYANGQTSGQNGNWHQDTSTENGEIPKVPNYTFLYYVSKDWDSSKYGGETLFTDYKNDDPLTVSYKYNRAVLFNSSIWHFARGPLSCCQDLRISLTYKLEFMELNYDDYLKHVSNKRNQEIEKYQQKIEELKSQKFQ